MSSTLASSHASDVSDDARGRALLLGDAAGHCGAATGGGIYPALLAGKLAAHAVA